MRVFGIFAIPLLALMCFITFIQGLRIQTLNNIIDNHSNEYYQIKEARVLTINNAEKTLTVIGPGKLRVTKDGKLSFTIMRRDTSETIEWTD